MNPEEWLEEYGDYLYGLALRRLKNAALAEDLVQDTFLSAFKGFSSFEGKSSVKTWLSVILKNKIYDHYLKNKNKTLEVLADEDLSSDFNSYGIWNTYVPDWARDPEGVLADSQFKKVFNNCSEGLPSKIGLAFKYKYLDGFNTEQICKLLEVSESNLWVLLYRARNALRACIEENWYNKQ